MSEICPPNDGIDSASCYVDPVVPMEVRLPRPTARKRHTFAVFAVGVTMASAVFCGAPSGGISVACAAPDAEAVRKARDSFDEGGRTYRAGNYELAASHFEAADAAVPSARALRMAIRANSKAGQEARAATLAAQALRRYPDDTKTKALAEETIAATEKKLHRLEVRCAEPCVLAIGTHAVHGQASDDWVLYLDEGAVQISASFEDGGDDLLDVQAVAGGSHSVELMPQRDDGGQEPTPVATPSAEPTEPPVVSGEPPDRVSVDGPSWIESPWVFGFWALATAGVGGATIWSGIDTLHNPGKDVVQQACVGQGTDCPEYQQGRASQLRTNVLIGATAGTAALATIFAIFVTDWDGEPDDEAAFVTPYGGPNDFGIGFGGRF